MQGSKSQLRNSSMRGIFASANGAVRGFVVELPARGWWLRGGISGRKRSGSQDADRRREPEFASHVLLVQLGHDADLQRAVAGGKTFHVDGLSGDKVLQGEGRPGGIQ